MSELPKHRHNLPPFWPKDVSRFAPRDVSLRILTPTVKDLWAWVANSYRLRGFDLLTCVAQANRCLRHHVTKHKVAKMKRKRHRNKQKRAMGDIPPSVRATMRTKREIARVKRLAKDRADLDRIKTAGDLEPGG